MSRKKLCICDYDEEYAERFSNFVWKRESRQIEVFTFSKLGALRDFMKTEAADAYLISEDFYKDAVSGSKKLKLPQDSTFVLTTEDTEIAEDIVTLCKYSSAAESLDTVLRKIGVSKAILPLRPRTKAQVIGVYSPCKRCGKTQLALELGRQLSRRGRTILVTYEDMCGTRLLQKDPDHLGISDVLYAYATDEAEAALSVLPMKTDGGLKLLLAASCAEDIREGERGTLRALLTRLGADEGFEYVVADLGDAVAEPFELLSICSRIIMPQLDDEVSALRMERFSSEAAQRIAEAESVIMRLKAPKSENEIVRAASGLIATFAG